MTQNNNSWRKTYFTLLAGQAISFISGGILQMAIIFYLVAKTNSAIILTAATLIGFLPQACLGPFTGAFVSRHSRKAYELVRIWYSPLAVFWRWWRFTWNCPYGHGCPVNPKCGNCFSFSSIQRSSTPMITTKNTKCAGYTQTMQAVSAIIDPAAQRFYMLFGLFVWYIAADIVVQSLPV